MKLERKRRQLPSKFKLTVRRAHDGSLVVRVEHGTSQIVGVANAILRAVSGLQQPARTTVKFADIGSVDDLATAALITRIERAERLLILRSRCFLVGRQYLFDGDEVSLQLNFASL